MITPAAPLEDPPTPPLNPLEHLLHQEDVADNGCNDRNDDADNDQVDHQQEASSSSLANLFPGQQHSIIDEKMIIRYYCDLAKVPHLVDEKDSTCRGQPSPPSPPHIDITLLCDVTNGCGGKIWPAAEVLGAYLSGRKDDLAQRWKGKRVLELGSGTGLVGFVVAKLRLGSETWITDQDAMLQVMTKCLSLNTDMDPCHIAELNWGQPLPSNVPQKPDVLLLADCVYLEVAFQPLVDTMIQLCTVQTEILFCYQKRRKADKRFFAILKKHFHFDDVLDDDPVRTQQYNRQGTRLYHMKLKG